MTKDNAEFIDLELLIENKDEIFLKILNSKLKNNLELPFTPKRENIDTLLSLVFDQNYHNKIGDSRMLHLKHHFIDYEDNLCYIMTPLNIKMENDIWKINLLCNFSYTVDKNVGLTQQPINDHFSAWKNSISGLKFDTKIGFDYIKNSYKDEQLSSTSFAPKTDMVYPFTFLLPNQRKIFNQLDHKQVVLDANFGKGKTYLFKEIALQSLLNDRTVIYVADTKSEINAFCSLFDENLAQLIFKWTDLSENFSMMLLEAQHRLKTNEIKSKSEFDSKNLIKNHQFSIKFKRDVDKLLSINIDESCRHLLNLHANINFNTQNGLDELEFEIIEKKYDKILSIINEFQRNHNFIDLEKLKSFNSLSLYQLDSQDEIAQCQGDLFEFSKFISVTINDIEQVLIDYKNELLHFFFSEYRILFGQYEKLKLAIQTFSVIYESNAYKYFDAKTSNFDKFFKKTNDYHQDRENIYSLYFELNRKHKKYQFFSIDELNQDKITYDALTKYIHQYESRLQSWHNKLYELINEECTRLNSKTLNYPTTLKSKIYNIEQNINDQFISINTKNIFHRNLELQSSSLPKIQAQLKVLLTECQHLLQILDYPIYYINWATNWKNLDKIEKNILKTLIENGVHGWIETFNNWFHQKKLHLSLMSDISDLKKSYDSQYDLHQELKSTYILKQNADNVEKNRKKFLKLCASFKEIVDLQFYEKWINNFDILKSCFPIICIDFQIFKNYLYNSNVTFDYIIFDNCLHFDDEMKQHLVSKSNKLIYQNNRAQVSNNASFDNPWNDILTKKNNISSSSVCIEGYCDENNKNIVEANYIFNILNNITQRPNFTYPKIGIICNSKSQRDLIQSMLLDIHANKKQGWEKLNHLERNGLKVLFANHLKKEKFDIIIYSFTYSFKNNIENLIDQLQTIDISTLQNLSSNANSEIKVVYSISDLWTEYLLSIDDEKISKILSFLRHRSFLSTNSTFEVANKYHNFIDLILKFITPYFNRDEIKVDKTHWLPIRIECNNTKFALITNGFLFYDNTPELYNFLEKHYMKNEAVIFKPIYFDEFVLNPEIYIKKIAGSIHANNILENDV